MTVHVHVLPSGADFTDMIFELNYVPTLTN